MKIVPPEQREDLRYGDPHNPRGAHIFYGPDGVEMADQKISQKKKPTLVSHGFYVVQGGPAKPSLWARLKSYFA